MINEIKKDLEKISDPKKAEHSKRFFKTGKGEYGEGDEFLGITVPELRKISVKYWKKIAVEEIEILLHSKYHEERLLALFLLVKKFLKAKEREREAICEMYLNNTEYVNNWDLLDSSAHYLLGVFLFDKDKTKLYELAKSDLLWERRIAILSTFHFIKNGEFKDALNIAEILVNDKEDLMHKAVGWMLREIGNRNLETEENFLKKYYKTMPRTMLRYAIEKFEKEKRLLYLKGLI